LGFRQSPGHSTPACIAPRIRFSETIIHERHLLRFTKTSRISLFSYMYTNFRIHSIHRITVDSKRHSVCLCVCVCVCVCIRSLNPRTSRDRLIVMGVTACPSSTQHIRYMCWTAAAHKSVQRDFAATDVVSGEQAPPRLHAGRGGGPPPRDLPNQELPITARANA